MSIWGNITRFRKALAILMVEGVADAETLCREGDVPSSKIYQAMEKLHRLGLVEIQPTRPKLYSAIPADEMVNRSIAISQERAARFSEHAERLRGILASNAGRVRGRRTFVDLALGMESHVKRHVIHLAAAHHRIWSYLEQGDLEAIEAATTGGLLDMLRYHLFDNAHVWKDEFGTADDPDDFAVLSVYSPYHRVRQGVAYPATMFISGDADKSCNSLHARKMTARLQAANASGNPIFLDYSKFRGHAPVLPLSERIDGLTDRLAFLCDQLKLSV